MTIAAADAWRLAALSMMDGDGLAVALSGAEAGVWVRAAAACGIAAAQVRLGRMLLEGEGIVKDLPAAFAQFGAAAGQDDIEAHNMLGRCHENGWGTPVDHAAAACHYGIAAEAGLDWAQYNLAHMLLSGSGVARDRTAAFDGYSKAAAQGHVRAMNLVGRCCERGWGTRRDPEAACDWYRRSAEGGYFRGAYNYASVLADKGERAAAKAWFQQALAAAPEHTRSVMIQAIAARGCFQEEVGH